MMKKIKAGLVLTLLILSASLRFAIAADDKPLSCEQSWGAVSGLLDDKDLSKLPKVSLKKQNEIRMAYMDHLKDFTPQEQERIIRLINAAEKKYSRARVQQELKQAEASCAIR